MAGTVGRYARVIKFVKEAEELARSGSLVLDDGDAAIYFLWGQPSHAYMQRDETRFEGEAALKEIAMDLARPGKVEWNNRDVLQVETLRCNAEELVEILQSMAVAGKEPPREEPQPFVPSPPASPPPPVADYDFDAFPLLPAGGVIWAEVPTNVVHLDVLLGALPTVLVTLEAPDAKAAGIVLRGELFDAIAMTGRRFTGREAWDYLLSCDNGSVSAFEVTEDLAETLPILWRNRVVSGGIESRWFDPTAFADSQLGVDEDRAVVINSSHGIGIGIFRRGRMVGAYSTNRPNSTLSLDPLSELVGPNFAGNVNVIERVPEDEGSPFIVDKPVEAPIPEPEVAPPAQSEAVTTPSGGLELELVSRNLASQALPEDEVSASEAHASAEHEQVAGEEPVAEPPDTATDSSQSEAVFGAAEPTAPEVQPEPTAPEVQTEPAPPEVQTEPAPPEVQAEPVPDGEMAAPLMSFDATPQASEPVATHSTEPSQGAAPLFQMPSYADAPSTGYAPNGAGLAVETQGNGGHDGGQPGADYGAIVTEMMAIGERFLQRDFAQVAPIIENCERSPEGLREAITALRDAEVPNQSPDRVRAAARAMQIYVADMVTGT